MSDLVSGSHHLGKFQENLYPEMCGMGERGRGSQSLFTSSVQQQQKQQQ